MTESRRVRISPELKAKVAVAALALVLGVARSTVYRNEEQPSVERQSLVKAAKVIHRAMSGSGTRKMSQMLTSHVAPCVRDRICGIMRTSPASNPGSQGLHPPRRRTSSANRRRRHPIRRGRATYRWCASAEASCTCAS